MLHDDQCTPFPFNTIPAAPVPLEHVDVMNSVAPALRHLQALLMVAMEAKHIDQDDVSAILELVYGQVRACAGILQRWDATQHAAAQAQRQAAQGPTTPENHA